MEHIMGTPWGGTVCAQATSILPGNKKSGRRLWSGKDYKLKYLLARNICTSRSSSDLWYMCRYVVPHLDQHGFPTAFSGYRKTM